LEKNIGMATAHCDRIHVTFVDKDGDRHEFDVAKGDNLLDIAQANELEMEGEQDWPYR